MRPVCSRLVFLSLFVSFSCASPPTTEELPEYLPPQEEAPTGEPLTDPELCKALESVHTDPGDLPHLSTTVGDKSYQLPLQRTDVKADLNGFIAKVEVTQTYKNNFPTPIEASYIFPLPENSAVFGMEMQIGDRVIFSEVKERQEARAIYESAKKDGYTAALLEQQRPNVFTQSVANIEPQKEIQVTIRYTQDLSYDAGYYEFVFPMVVGPRFFPPASDKDEARPAEPGEEAINPPLFGRGTRPHNDISLSVTLQGLPIKHLSVPTHQIKTQTAPNGDTHITLAEADSLPNRDFVLRYKTGSEETQTTLLAHKTQEKGVFSLVIQPPQMDVKELIGDRELIFVVDISGSMNGTPIEMCKDAMKEALSQLRPVDTFNILTFAGATELLFPKPRPANTANISEALGFIDNMMAGGGTYMANAVEQALSPEVEAGRGRYVFFLTDGYVGNENEIKAATQSFVQTLKEKKQRAKVFSFGVGASPNRELLEGIATAGEGLAVYASTREDPARAVNQFYRYIDHSVLEDLSIDWGGLSVEEVYPEVLPDLFASRPILIHGRYTKSFEGTITIKGKLEGKEVSLPIKVSLPEKEETNLILGTLWARAKITSLSRKLWEKRDPSVIAEITKLGLEYHLVTAYTSLVAVDRSQKVSDGDPTKINQPSEAPEGTETPMWLKSDSRGKKHAGDEGKMGKKSSHSGLYGMKGPAGTESTLAGMVGDRPGEAEGGSGVGLRGAGIGGGGTGEGTIGLGSSKTKDHANAGFGTKSASGAEVTDGKADIKGSLDKEIIRRVIRRAINQIKFCYEQGLQTNPSLSGRVKIFFVIAADGSVASASPVGAGLTKEINQCVARKISQLSFPAPEGGGIVEVTYPFNFANNAN